MRGHRFWRCAPESDLKDSLSYDEKVLEEIEENGGRFGDGVKRTQKELLESVKGGFSVDTETGDISLWGRTESDLETGRQLIEKLYGDEEDVIGTP